MSLRIVLIAPFVISFSFAALSNDAIVFDMQHSAPAVDVLDDQTCETSVRRIRCDFQLSSMIVGPADPKISQWFLRLQPRDPKLKIVDYAPKTDAASDIEASISIKDTNERSRTLGLSFDSALNSISHGHLVADSGSKNTRSSQYSLRPTLNTVTASGTFSRGKGVFFKWRRTADQILEGDKTFHVTFEVPLEWSTSLLDVSVVAQRERRILLDTQVVQVGKADFVVAVFDAQDKDAAMLAERLAKSEEVLRQEFYEVSTRDDLSLPTLLHRVANSVSAADPYFGGGRWLAGVLSGTVDPYLDREVQRLAMPLRRAVIQYAEARDDFVRH